MMTTILYLLCVYHCDVAPAAKLMPVQVVPSTGVLNEVLITYYTNTCLLICCIFMSDFVIFSIDRERILNLMSLGEIYKKIFLYSLAVTWVPSLSHWIFGFTSPLLVHSLTMFFLENENVSFSLKTWQYHNRALTISQIVPILVGAMNVEDIFGNVLTFIQMIIQYGGRHICLPSFW